MENKNNSLNEASSIGEAKESTQKQFLNGHPAPLHIEMNGGHLTLAPNANQVNNYYGNDYINLKEQQEKSKHLEHASDAEKRLLMLVKDFEACKTCVLLFAATNSPKAVADVMAVMAHNKYVTPEEVNKQEHVINFLQLCPQQVREEAKTENVQQHFRNIWSEHLSNKKEKKVKLSKEDKEK